MDEIADRPDLQSLLFKAQPDRVVLLDGGARRCRICYCTQDNACVDPVHGACWWVEPDLCSHCGEPAIVAATFDRISLDKNFENSTAIVMWCTKARAALGRASRVDPAAFEI